MTRAEYEEALAVLRRYAQDHGGRVSESKHSGSAFGTYSYGLQEDESPTVWAARMADLGRTLGAMTVTYRPTYGELEILISRDLDAADYAPTCAQCGAAREVTP